MARSQSRKSSSLHPRVHQAHESTTQEGKELAEIRRFLLKIAKKKGIKIKEHQSLDPCPLWFCRLESLDNFSTACSYSGPNAALIMAFFSFANSDFNFLP